MGVKDIGCKEIAKTFHPVKVNAIKAIFDDLINNVLVELNRKVT